MAVLALSLVGLAGRASAASACSAQLLAASPATSTAYLDGATPATACSQAKCRGSFAACAQPGAATKDMVLVFSDEFEGPRNFKPKGDSKWQALNLHYDVNGDVAAFRDSSVTVEGGSAVITVTRESVEAPVSGRYGDRDVTLPYKSGMLQGWNKFCYTGGYLEARIKMPGGTQSGGLWPAVFTMGNLGRAGYVRSTEGMWPFSYDVCDAAATQEVTWSKLRGQTINKCNSTQGRGSPEIDLFEVGVWQAGKPALSTSLQMAPLLPPETHWLDIANGTYLPTADDPDLLSHPNSWAGVNSYPGHPRPGSDLQDAISAIHSLNASHFESFHTYGVDWLPGAGGYVRWYLDGRLIFEINDAALQGQANSRTQSVGDRVIPREPSYLNINIAMADTFAPIDPNLPLPARMEVDYIRVYQPADGINIGCDPPGFPTREFIACHIDRYKLTAWDDEADAGRCSANTASSNAMLLVLIPCVVGGPLVLLLLVWFVCRLHVGRTAKIACEPFTAAAAALQQQARTSPGQGEAAAAPAVARPPSARAPVPSVSAV